MAITMTIKERINQLNPAGFQILCDAYLSRIGYPNLVSLGTKDGEQKTTPGTPDTYFCNIDGKYVFAEYTTQKASLISKIQSDIQKCMDENYTKVKLTDIVEIVYCHTSSNIRPSDDNKLKSLCIDKGIKLTIIGIDTLAEELRKYPALIKEHLHLSIDTEQVQLVDDFVKQYNSNALVATLDTSFSFREDEIASIDDSFTKVDITLLTGPAGNGKTRLALQYAQNQSFSKNVFVIHDRSLPLINDLKLYLEIPGSYFIVIDDANQLSEIELIIEYANKRDYGYNVKFLITVRDYALSKVEKEISHIARYEVVQVCTFTDDEIKKIIQNHFKISNPYYLDRIADIAEGNARIAMLAGKIASDANRLDSINDVTELYEDYYGKALHEAELDSDIPLLVSAGVIAFLNAIHLDYIEPILPILEDKGLSLESFKEKLRILHEYEIIDICNDKGVRFSEQCFANYIMKYVFCDKQIISLKLMIEVCFNAYHQRTIHAVSTLYNVFRSEDLHTYIRSEIIELWKKLEKEESPDFMKYVKAFYPLNQTETLLILKRKVDDITPVEIPIEEIDTESGKNYQNFDDEIITILGGFVNTDNWDAALELFFEYYQKRPDIYMQFYHVSIDKFSINRFSLLSDCSTQIRFFKKVIEYADGWSNQYITILFLNIAEHFLQLVFSPYEQKRNDDGIIIYQIPLKESTGVRAYRRLILEQVDVLASDKCYTKYILKILQNYGRTIDDSSKGVIRGDSDYICKLVLKTLKPEVLEHCLVVQRLEYKFKNAGIHTEDLNKYLKNSKMKCYRLLKGERWNADIDYEEYRKRKITAVIENLQSSDDLTYRFAEMLNVYKEIASNHRRNCYEITESINGVMKTLSDNSDVFLSATQMMVECEVIDGIDVCGIVHELFAFISLEEVLRLLSLSNAININQWMYAYYHEIPEHLINKKEIEGLYTFLKDDSDKLIKSSPCRDIDFLGKFKSVDEQVICKASKLILDKKRYSPFIVNIYFSLLFNEHHNGPSVVVEIFKDNLELLKQIYIYLDKINEIFDQHGYFLYEICKNDGSFLIDYINEHYGVVGHYYSRNEGCKLCAFYQGDNYIDIIDNIANVVSEQRKLRKSVMLADLIKQFLVFPGEKREYSDKCDEWIIHFITVYSGDKYKMVELFEAISETSLQWMPKYLKIFCIN